jgi:hypothetical protein
MKTSHGKKFDYLFNTIINLDVLEGLWGNMRIIYKGDGSYLKTSFLPEML